MWVFFGEKDEALLTQTTLTSGQNSAHLGQFLHPVKSLLTSDKLTAVFNRDIV